MTHLRYISAMLLVLGFTGLLLTGAIDWSEVRVDPETSWQVLCGTLTLAGLAGTIKWRVK